MEKDSEGAKSMDAKELKKTDSLSGPSRREDISLSFDQLLGVSFFRNLIEKPVFQQPPGKILLRFGIRGDILCRQGEPGWTFMCLLNHEDLNNLKGLILDHARESDSEEEVSVRLKQMLDPNPLVSGLAEAGPRILVYKAFPKPPDHAVRKGVLSWFFSEKKESVTGSKFLPVGPSPGIDYEIRQASIFEGELFGELNCMDGAPRSATLVVENDCYFVEVPGKLLGLFEKEPRFREKADKTYLKRGFEHELLSLSIFEDLNEEQILRVKAGAEMIRCHPGETIFQENDLSDSIYIIRSGMVQTVKGQTELIGLADIPDWRVLFEGLAKLESPTAPESWHQIANRLELPFSREQILDPSQIPHEEKQEWVHKFNDFLKNPFADYPELSLPEAPDGISIGDLWPVSEGEMSLRGPFDSPDLEKEIAKWTSQMRTTFGRNWIEAVVGKVFLNRNRSGETAQVLSYMGKGEFFGEMGVLADQPRSATCIGYAHPDPAQPGKSEITTNKEIDRMSLVELVRIPGDLFLEILADAPTLRRKVDGKVAKRNRNDQILLSASREAWQKTL